MLDKSRIHYAACLAVLLATSGCAVRTPPVTSHSDGFSGQIRSVEFVEADNSNEAGNALRNAVSSKFTGRGIAATSASPASHVVDLAVARHDAEMSLRTGSRDAKNFNNQVEPRSGHWLDGCKAERVRATLALYDGGSGKLAGRSSAETTVCAGDALDFDGLANSLVSGLLGGE